MKQTVRFSVWETNSSSVHSLTLCTKDEYEKFEKNEAWYDRKQGKIVEKWNGSCESYNTFWDDAESWAGCFETRYTAPSGEQIVAFGYYGYDG